MSEENENSAEEEKNKENPEENEKEDENEKEHESGDEKEKENFTSYEDDIITLLNKLSETIETFNTLSKKQADNAILETNIKISSCKNILDKMEEYINNLKTEDESEKAELNKKLLNYKTEYYELLNKFKEIQDNYINQKTESALMDENLIDEDDNNKNDIRMTAGSTGNNNAALGAGNPHMIDGELDEEKNNKKNNININNKKENENKNKNKESIIINNIKAKERNNNNINNEISLVSVFNTNNLGYNLSPNKEKEETFHEINRDRVYDKKKKLMILVCVAICIFIFLLIFFIALLS